MPLSSAQKQELIQQGYAHLEGAIAPAMVERAVHTINHRLGQGVPSEELPKWSAQSFFPDLQDQPVVTDLFNESGVRDDMEELLGEGNVKPASRAQLALRFPRAPGTPAQSPGAHIDGIPTATNGVTANTLGSFTALVGVFLTDVPREYAGNFTVWPGSHHQIEAYFREHGLDDMLANPRTPKVEGIEPVQIQARAGDVVIAHYQLLHGVAMNLAPWPRYACFFRVTHPTHHDNRLDALTDLWKEWPGLAPKLAMAD